VVQTSTNHYWRTFVTATCNGGVLTFSASSQEYFGPFSGPSVPKEFVLRTITCDVAVFDEPGGNPVGDNRIKQGQTWYVSNESVKDKNGKLWTAVFVSSFDIPYIPTECAFPGQTTKVVTKIDASTGTGGDYGVLSQNFGPGGGGGVAP
jgi:hypothetical protein